MTLPAAIDFDKLVLPVLKDAGDTLRGWLSGHPRDESAFLNRLTEKLDRTRRGCDVGLAEPMTVKTSVAMLHRKGARQTDQYGCDLAVTVSIEPGVFRKTALFQFKRSANFQLKVERTQLDDALSDSRIAPRSFVLAIEEVRQTLRLESATELRNAFGKEAQKTFDALDWKSAAEWLHGWLRCDIGPSSLGPEDDGVEALLRQFVVDAPALSLFDDFGDVRFDADFVPAEAWLRVVIAPEEAR